MTHLECGLYGISFERCPDCPMVWCPRCRIWFSPSGDTGKDGDGG